MNLDHHPYVYHKNICIHHRVHEVVHSEYPGKTQKLNIRTYFDRENIFIAMYTVNKNPLHLKSCVIYINALDD